MLFTIIILAIIFIVFFALKKKIDKSNSIPVHTPLEEIEIPVVEEPQDEIIVAAEIVPTTPPSKPTMKAKPKKKTTSKNTITKKKTTKK